MAKILVTGGAGYIGSHTIIDLLGNGFEVISIDNFSHSSLIGLEAVGKITNKSVLNHNINLCDFAALENFFEHEKEIAGIIHFAAFKAVGESVEKPLMYYENNIVSLLNLLKCVDKFNIKHFVFSSSCSVYGNAQNLPVTEETPLAPSESPYATTKQMGEQILTDLSKISSVNIVLLRYFNPVGAHLSGLNGEVPIGKPNNLVPVITQTAAGLLPMMHVWGGDYDTRDGSCIRDYIHVMDIANAHTKSITYLIKNNTNKVFEIFNLGSGNGVSVIEAIHSFEKVSGLKLNYKISERRAGDVISIYADNSKAKELLAWKPIYTIDDMMLSAWQWQQYLQNLDSFVE